nr:receptor-like protein 33 [Coffea arabica]
METLWNSLCIIRLALSSDGHYCIIIVAEVNAEIANQNHPRHNGVALVALPTALLALEFPVSLSWKSLTFLDLRHNMLEGPLPPSICDSENLKYLLLAENKLNGTNSSMLGKFQGPIATSKTKLPFPKLRIFDISHNEFTGILPADLPKNFRAMTSLDSRKELEYIGNRFYYVDSVTLVMKGKEIEFVRVLKLFTAVDLSSNKFQSEIPKSIGNLISVRGNSMAAYKTNLSCILQPLPKSSSRTHYSSDLALCGFPLKDCGEIEAAQSPAKAETSQRNCFGILGWFPRESAVSGHCFGMVVGLCIGGLLFTGKPRWFLPSVAKDTHQWSRSGERMKDDLGLRERFRWHLAVYANL